MGGRRSRSCRLSTKPEMNSNTANTHVSMVISSPSLSQSSLLSPSQLTTLTTYLAYQSQGPSETRERGTGYRGRGGKEGKRDGIQRKGRERGTGYRGRGGKEGKRDWIQRKGRERGEEGRDTEVCLPERCSRRESLNPSQRLPWQQETSEVERMMSSVIPF